MDADGVFIDAGATVSADASLEGPMWLGRGVVVEAGARVGPNVVIGPGCTVRAGASVRESVLMLGAEVNRQSWQQLVCGRASARAV
jgi:NDP-sugar pyrophosphorylase family protein